MFDWVYRLLGYELKKDERKKYVDKKIQEEIEDAIFKKKCLETPSFSKCVIPKCIEKSQKQKEQIKSYRDAVAPPTPPQTRSRSKSIVL